jgi:hypothetical protein
MGKPAIFVFRAGTTAAGWLSAVALAEDGELLGSLLCRDRTELRLGLGLDSTENHDVYRHHFSDGYELVEVRDADLLYHCGLHGALRRHRELGLAISA